MRINECNMMSFAFLVYTLLPILLVLQGVAPQQGDLRLQNDDGDVRYGRLEIYYNGEWGSICTNNFNEEEARVACRQLGLDTSTVEYFDSSKYGAGGTIWLDQVSCVGTEQRLDSCSHDSIGTHSCTSSMHVGIECGEIVNEGDLRLQNNDGGTGYGRLEIYYNGTWGTVCDDNFGEAEARVVCRALGLPTSNADSSSSWYGEGTGPIWLDEVSCSGRESELTMCSHDPFGTHDCSHSEDVGVSCEEGGSSGGSYHNYGSYGGLVGVFVTMFFVSMAMYRRRQIMLHQRQQQQNACVYNQSGGTTIVTTGTANPGTVVAPSYPPPQQSSEPRPYPVQTYGPVAPPPAANGVDPPPAYPPPAQNPTGQAPPYPTQLPAVESDAPYPPPGTGTAYPPPSAPVGVAYPSPATAYPPTEDSLPPPPSYNEVTKPL